MDLEWFIGVEVLKSEIRKIECVNTYIIKGNYLK